MKELNDEIKLTLNTMQTDIDEGAHSELQFHLHSLLEIKRNEIRQRLAGSQVVAKPLTAVELRAGGWWCADTSEDTIKTFILFGLKDGEYAPWDGSYSACFLVGTTENSVVVRTNLVLDGLKQIHRVGNEFYWS